jgi:hypothetical protein
MTETLPQAVSLWRHPRRWGFIAFNLIAVAVLVSWIVATQNDAANLGVMGLPYYALGYLGMAFLVVAWIAAWVAWIWMVARRRRLKA